MWIFGIITSSNHRGLQHHQSEDETQSMNERQRLADIIDM
jgi:hypothetical protein